MKTFELSFMVNLAEVSSFFSFILHPALGQVLDIDRQYI